MKELYGLDLDVTFRNVSVASDNKPRPLYLGTATQIGMSAVACCYDFILLPVSSN